MGKLTPTVGKCYKHPSSGYTYLVTKVGDTHYEFVYVLPFPDMHNVWTFRLSEFIEIELTELEQALI